MQKLTLALQKSGRLSQACISLLQKCGLSIHPVKNQLLVQDRLFGIDFLFTRDDDILGLIRSGVCDAGVIGQNVLQEFELPSDPLWVNNTVASTANTQQIAQPVAIKTALELGFSRCRLSLALPKTTMDGSAEKNTIKQLSDLNGKTIATAYPNQLKKFLQQHQLQAKIVIMHGSVELAPQIGIADCICDLVSTGATLQENGLREWITVAHSQAVLVRNDLIWSDEKQQQFDRLLARIKGVMQAERSRYILLHLDRARLPELKHILPGCESPTVLSLEGFEDKVAVHVVSVEEVFWDTIECLKAMGASSILVLPIEKMIA